MNGALLELRDLSVAYEVDHREVHAVTDAFLDVEAGEGVGIVGESGSGKSTLARALAGLLPSRNARVVAGRLRVGGDEFAAADKEKVRSLRGHTLAMVFQDPLSYLNPLMTVRAQIAEAVRLNDRAAQVDRRVAELLDLVRLSQRCLAAFPHELSGGMRQRVLLAIALGCRPKILIADEPTTALDVTTQAEILALLKDIKRELGMALVLISHDLGVVANLCDRVFVMYGGRTVETGPSAQILHAPAHPYTKALVLAARSVRGPGGKFVTLDGVVPNPTERISGCAFRPRCSAARADCAAAVPPVFVVGGDRNHLARCFLHAPAEH